MKLLDDTSPEARRVMVEAYRRIPPGRRWRLLDYAYRHGRMLHDSGYRNRHPDASPLEIHLDWIRQSLGEKYVGLFPSGEVQIMPTLEQTKVVLMVVAAFRRMGIVCALGGSNASSYHGVRRSTEDADLTAEPFSGREAEFASLFGPEFYADATMIRSAIQNRSSFNLIHWPTGFKVDVFIRKDRAFDRFVMQRRIEVEPEGLPGEKFDVVSAEDIILLKLEWFRLGGEVSDRQWSDILGVLRVQAGRLDDAYLDYWAADLKVADLLQEARSQI